jgi:HlyD family secretion protein
VALGDSVIVEVDSYSSQDEKFKGVVTAIANTAKDAASLEAVTEFEVRIRLLNDSYSHLAKNNRRPFRPGMTATVDIITARKNDVLSVPLSAVTTRSAKAVTNDKKTTETKAENNGEAKKEEAPAEVEEVVFAYDSTTNKVNAVKVKTGISDFDNIEILSGLKKGQQVVAGPFRAVSKLLKDGALVAVKDEKSLNKAAIAADNTDTEDE